MLGLSSEELEELSVARQERINDTLASQASGKFQLTTEPTEMKAFTQSLLDKPTPLAAAIRRANGPDPAKFLYFTVSGSRKPGFVTKATAVGCTFNQLIQIKLKRPYAALSLTVR